MKSKAKGLLGLLIICLGWNSAAQTLQFVDSSNLEGIEGVFVEIDDGYQAAKAVSDKNGKIDLKGFKIPATIRATHINYEGVSATLSDFSAIVELKPKSLFLDELVVTGQYFPQSASNSLFRIRTIDQDQIQSRAYVNLEQIFTQELNMRISNDPSTASSSMSMMGIGERNIKFLVDGAPITGMTGNSTDPGQLNLNNIERIEIIEGPMAVNYGTNAMAGVINIITRKPERELYSVAAYVHEETVGNEYGLMEGIHQEAVTAQLGFSPAISAWIDLQRNYFGGFKGSLDGRSYQWLPKTQWKSSGKVHFQSQKINGSYRVEFLDELIENPAEPSSIFNPVALDEDYKTIRLMNVLDLNKSVTNGSLNFLASRSDYKRTKTQYANNLATGEKPLSLAAGSQDTTVFGKWNFRSSLKKIPSKNFGFEFGMDFTFDKTSGGRILNKEARTQNDFAIYGSAELTFNQIAIRPAARALYNSDFGFQVVPSVNIKYDLNENSGLRFAYGRGFRSPALRELFFEFRDSNHNILGNENLNPEIGDHLSLNFFMQKTGRIRSTSEITVFYNNIRDQIEFGQSPDDPQLTTYINISNVQTTGFLLQEQINYSGLTAQAGFGYTGTKSFLDGGFSDSRFLFNSEITGRLEYQIPGIEVTAGISYKYTGKVGRYFYATDSLGISTISKGLTDDYHWLDFNATKKFRKILTLNFGVRNIFDRKQIGSTVPGTSVHTSGTRIVGYGRSYFVRLNFLLTNNKTNKK